MNTITVNDDLMERLVIESNARNIDANELANKYILQGLEEDNVIPNEVENPKAILDLLDHDKPEGDNVLESIVGIIDVESKFNAVELKKLSQIR